MSTISAQAHFHIASMWLLVGQVRSVAVDASGQWLVSGSDDGSVRLWEVATARCMRTWNLASRVHCVAWCPAAGLRILSAAAGNSVFLLPAGDLPLALLFIV